MADAPNNNGKKARKSPAPAKPPTLGLDAEEKKVTMGKVKFTPAQARKYASTLTVLADAASNLQDPEATS